MEEIAARLDQEIARPSAPAAIDPRPFDDLARRIDEVRQTLEARAPAAIDIGPIEKLLGPIDRQLRDLDAKLDAAGHTDGDARALQSMAIEISGKLDRLANFDAGVRWLEPVLSEFGAKLDRVADAEIGARWLEPVLGDLGARVDAVASTVDLNPIESLLRGLEAKLEASGAAPTAREIAEIGARWLEPALGDLGARVDADRIYGRSASDREPAARPRRQVRCERRSADGSGNRR